MRCIGAEWCNESSHSDSIATTVFGLDRLANTLQVLELSFSGPKAGTVAIDSPEGKDTAVALCFRCTRVLCVLCTMCVCASFVCEMCVCACAAFQVQFLHSQTLPSYVSLPV